MIPDDLALNNAYLNTLVISELLRTAAIIVGVAIAYLVHKDKIAGNPGRIYTHTRRNNK